MTAGRPAARRDLVVIGASAGGIEALRSLLRRLPPNLAATVLVVVHLPATGAAVLPDILARASALPVAFCRQIQPLQPGRVVIAPADHHLVLWDGYASINRGPKENGHRPAVDVLFRSVARSAAGRVIGVVLSGALDDGAAGAGAIKQHGGLVLVQDPTEALYPSMPQAVLAAVAVDGVATAAGIGELIGELIGTSPMLPDPSPAASPTPVPAPPVPVPPTPVPPPRQVTALDAMPTGVDTAGDARGGPTGFGCPQCHAPLFETSEAGVPRYRCWLGHAWSAHSLLVEQGQTLETALWTALRVLEERAVLSRQLADLAADRGSDLSRQRFLEQAGEAARSAELVRRLLTAPPGPDPQAAIGSTDRVERHAVPTSQARKPCRNRSTRPATMTRRCHPPSRAASRSVTGRCSR